MFTAKEFGVKGDGQAKDTAAIQKAIDHCAARGGGTVALEPGVYLSGTLWLRSNVELHLMAGAKLQGSQSQDDYEEFAAPGFKGQFAPEGSAKCLLCADHADNIAITGPGEINGAGPSFYDTAAPLLWSKFYSKPPHPRPRMLMLHQCRDVRISDASFVDSPSWTFWLINCQRVNIHRVKVLGDQKMINNDGIDIDSCRQVTLSDSFIQTGDDCVVLRAIQNIIDAPAVCEGVVVSNCVLSSACQAIRVGCPGDNVIRNCAFSNIVIQDSNNGINVDNPRRYLPEGNPGSLDLQDIAFSNFTIACEGHPIRIHVEDGVKLKRLSGLSFSNFRIRGGLPCVVEGSKETMLEDISFNAVSVEAACEDALIVRRCRNLKLNAVELSATPA